MSSASVARHLSIRLTSLQPHLRNNNLNRTFSPTLSYRPSSALTSPPRRTFSLAAQPAQAEAASVYGSSIAALPFAELVARTSSFLVDYYEAPSASPLVAAQLLSALQQFPVSDAAQQRLKQRLEGELDELVAEATRRRERRLGDERPPSPPLDTDADDILRSSAVSLDDDEVLEQRIVARPSSPLHDLSSAWHDGELPAAARGKFDDGYSTDQLLVDSLPSLAEEEAVQLGRRDVMRLMGTVE